MKVTNGFGWIGTCTAQFDETVASFRDILYEPDDMVLPKHRVTVRTKTHKCTFELDSGAGELYDLMNDPEEMEDRFDDPAYAKTRQELEDMMRARPGKILERLPEPVGMG